ncbi:MAG: hypothetical protein ABIQ52_13095 [Vicinamibacterales bacterium]
MNDTHIQALADGEGTLDASSHAASCAPCGERLRERQRLMGAIRQTLDVPVPLSQALSQSVGEMFQPMAASAGKRRTTGATRMRSGLVAPSSRLRRASPARWVYSGAAVAAASVIAVLFVAPIIKGPDATVSASEILAESASRLSAVVASGVETFEYELVLDGVPREMMPDQVDGTYKVSQTIDHDVPGRFRFASYASDGRMMTSIAQDPLRHRRVMVFTVEGQPFRFDVALPVGPASMSLPEMERLHMQASIAMMQASGNQLLETIDGPNGRMYRIEVPRVIDPSTNPVWDLTEARVLIDARDFRVAELSVRGSFLKQPYSLSYKLTGHRITARVAPEAFDVPAQTGEIVIHGQGSNIPMHDVFVLALGELAKRKLAE